MTEWRDSRIPWRVLLFKILALIALNTFPLSALPVAQSPWSAAKPVTGSTVSGVLLGPSGAPQANVRVGLIKVRLVSLLGEEIRSLPPRETIIIDSDGKPVALAETDSGGRFEFKEVPRGRYSVAVQSKAASGAAEPAWLESGGKTILFDVGGGQRVKIGTVNPRKQR